MRKAPPERGQSEGRAERVQAIGYFTKEDDGLEHDWRGRVWLNPPYAQPAIAQFVSKMVAERRAGSCGRPRTTRRCR
jgi:hypothetical protein